MKTAFLDRRGRLIFLGLAGLTGLLALAFSPSRPDAGSNVVAGPGAVGGAGGTVSVTLPGGAPDPLSGAAVASQPAPGAGTPGATTPDGAPAPTGPGPSVEMGHGITESTIRVGVFLGDFAGLQNVEGFSTGDGAVQARAVVDAINANGGIGGRQIELFVAAMPATSRNWDADEQAICSQFTEDANVFAVVYTLLSEGKTLQPCLASHDVPLIAPAGGPHDQQAMDANRSSLYYPGGLNLTRAAAAYAEGLVGAGFFAPGDRVGLVRPDDGPFARAADEQLRPRLAAHGIEIEEEAVVNAQTSIDDTASQIPSVVLRFQQAGINKVLFLDNGLVGALFVTQASSQVYFPTYGFNSHSNPNFFVANVPPQALEGSMGVGWLPALDVDAQREPPLGAAADSCAAIMLAAGQGDVDRSGVMIQRNLCDGFTFLQHVLTRGPALTTGGMLQAVEASGSSFVASQTFATAFGPGRYDGATQTRVFTFTPDCRCYQYTGAPTATP